MSRLMAVAALSLTVSVQPSALAGGDQGSEGSGPFQFALIGDVPYNGGAPGEPYVPFDRLIDEVNADARIRWVLHAGDIKNGSTPCSDEMFLDRLARYRRFRKPFVLTLGDNEWTDCHRVNNGEYAPLERLARLREIFFPQPGTTVGAAAMTVDTQASRAGFEEFPENVRWSTRGVAFATMHIVGSQNALAPFDPRSRVVRTPEDDAEVARRTAAALAWMDETFAQARADGSAGVFLMIHGNPGLEFSGPVDRRGFTEFLTALERHAAAYGKPVVLAHGDSHYFRVDMPRLVTRGFLKNLTRVETFGALNVHWVRVTVDPRRPEVFRFDAEIVDAN